jgi:hypothetical protein
VAGPFADDTEERRRFAAPSAHGVFDDVDLSLLDPADPDQRRFLIRAEHLELAGALEREDDEVGVDEVNPRLHLTIHEIIATQLWDNDPPEVWQTAKRLIAAGYERHEILHMLGSALTSEIWHVLSERRPDGNDRYLHALAALPGSWEAQRPS